MLDGRRATTSWWLAPVFRSCYPAVSVDDTRMVTTCDGITTAGAAFSHVDRALAIVCAHSPALADVVRRFLVIDDRPSRAAYTIPSAPAAYDPIVSSFDQWVRARLADPLSIAAAARDLGVSERTLQRAVGRTLGRSPIRFVQDLCVERARHLLTTTDLPMTTVARRVGYENPGALRALLRDPVGATARSLPG